MDHLPVQTQILHNYLTGDQHLPPASPPTPATCLFLPPPPATWSQACSPVETALATMASSQAKVVEGERRVVAELQGGASVAQVVAKFRKACGLPGSFQGSLGGLLLQVLHLYLDLQLSSILSISNLLIKGPTN